MVFLYSKEKDSETHEYEVINQNEAKRLGWEQHDLEFNGKWYLSGFLPKVSLDVLKLEKRSEINKARDEAEQGGFVYLNKVFDSDQVSCQRISMAAQAMALAPGEATITWTCQDNTTVDLTAQELVGMVAALAHWSNECHIKATALKEQIDLAETEEDLEKIQWNAED